jgi:hypothetical protein
MGNEKGAMRKKHPPPLYRSPRNYPVAKIAVSQGRYFFVASSSLNTDVAQPMNPQATQQLKLKPRNKRDVDPIP